ncbi:hypothetical protein KUCAC02_002414 [Chaenocephalus aceratus]|uniref:Uncharacterized protein n=1 Tax=Chaenocephalus aceratus TaxID=36190 RepID=A0ACB9XUP7_CHAAC|nr:hypothetical protein KUCAC02_002414 [Chaenocephalus aceratus]
MHQRWTGPKRSSPPSLQRSPIPIHAPSLTTPCSAANGLSSELVVLMLFGNASTYVLPQGLNQISVY